MSDPHPPDFLHLALIIERFSAHVGGAERSATQIVDALLARGHRVTVLTGCCPDEPTHPGLTIEQAAVGAPHGVARLLAFTRWARRRLDDGPFDTSLSLTTLVPAAVVQPRAGLVIQSQHRDIARRSTPAARFTKTVLVALSARRQVMRYLERMTLRSARVQRLVAISRYMADAFAHYYDIDPERIDLIPNAAEVPAVDDAQRHAWREQIRRGLGIPEGHTVYLFPAMDPWRKGLEPLLRALKRLIDAERPVTLVLAGSERYGQQALAARLGVRDHVRIVGPTRQMHALYCAADVTVLPTFHDPASKVVIESLMLGTPAISTAYNGASEFLAGPGVPEPRGRVIDDPADDAALAEAMIELMDPVARERCRAAAAGLAEPLTMARHVDRLEAVLVGTLQGGRGGAAAAAEGKAEAGQVAEVSAQQPPAAETRSFQRP